MEFSLESRFVKRMVASVALKGLPAFRDTPAVECLMGSRVVSPRGVNVVLKATLVLRDILVVASITEILVVFRKVVTAAVMAGTARPTLLVVEVMRAFRRGAFVAMTVPSAHPTGSVVTTVTVQKTGANVVQVGVRVLQDISVSSLKGHMFVAQTAIALLKSLSLRRVQWRRSQQAHRVHLHQVQVHPAYQLLLPVRPLQSVAAAPASQFTIPQFRLHTSSSMIAVVLPSFLKV